MHKRRGVLLAVILGMFLLLPLMAQARTATPIDSWAKTNTFTTNVAIALNAVADDGAGTYVAVGNLGIALRSTDGENWDLRVPSATGNKNLLGVAYGSTPGFTGFIAVGDSKAVVKSIDGQSWTVVSQPANIIGNLKAITFGDNQWVAVGDQGGVFTYDGNVGNTWTRQAITTTSPIVALTSSTLNSIIYVPSQHRYTAVGTSGVVLVSFDGFYWEKEVITAGGTLQGVAYGVLPGASSGLYVAVNSAATVFVSGDGFTNWAPHKIATTEIAAGNLRAVTFAANPADPTTGTFVVAGNKGYIYWLDDFFGWVPGVVPTRWGTNPPLPILTNIKAIGGNSTGTRFYAVGESQTILTTTDIKFWPYRSTSNPTARLAAAAFGNGLFVTAGQFGNIFTSPDGSRWSESRLTKFDNTLPMIESITYGNGLFVAVGDADSLDTVTPVPAIFTSADGLTWTQRSSNTFVFGHAFLNQDLYGVASGTVNGNPGWAAVGSNGTIITSTLVDASLWVLRNSPTNNALNGITYGAGNFVAVGNKGTILYSADGVLWNTVNLGTTVPYFQSVAFGNGRFVAVASNGNVYYTQTSDPSQPWVKVNNTAMTAGFLGVTYGANSQGGFAGFVAVGNGGAVWESPDGFSWLKVTTGQALGINLEAVAFGNDTFVAAGGGSIIITRVAPGP